MIQSYPPEVKEFARNFYEESLKSGVSISYSDLAKEVQKQFPDIFPDKPPSKATIKRWVSDIRSKVFEEEVLVEKVPEKKIEEPSKVRLSGDTPEQYRELDQVTPSEIADKLLERSTVVETKAVEPEEVDIDFEEEPEEKKPFYMNRLLWIAAGITVVGIIVLWFLRRRSERKKPAPTAQDVSETQIVKPKPIPKEVRL